MKPRIVVSFIVSLFLAALVWTVRQPQHPLAQSAATSAALPALQGVAASDYLKQQGLHASLGAAMAAARYGVYEAPDKEQSAYRYYANNPAQRWQARFAPAGMSLHPASSAPDSWQLGMQLRSVGYGTRQHALTPGTLTAQGNRIEYTRQLASQQYSTGSGSDLVTPLPLRYGTGSGSDLVTPLSYLVENQVATAPRTAPVAITEWYVNRAEGLEQGFTLAQPPSERDASEPLRLVMSVNDGWHMRAVEAGRAVELQRVQSGATLRYDKLVVQDATGRELSARMRTQGRELWLEVEEAGAVYPVTIDPTFTQVKKLVASDGAMSDWFGSAVAISGDTAVVGARYDDLGGVNQAGSAYIFERNQGGTDNWGQVQKIVAADGATDDLFGWSVAISGNTIIVGASQFNGTSNVNKGAAYVFNRNQGGSNNWGQVQKLLAPDGVVNDRFGETLAISGDTVIVGAYRHQFGANFIQGAAYIFRQNIGGANNWGLTREIVAIDDAQDIYFGLSVGINSDTVIVGAGNNAAYLFERNLGGTDNWGQIKKIVQQSVPAVESAAFGASVAINNDTVIVGSPQDHVNGVFGAGAAYIFERNAGGSNNWGQVRRLIASDGAMNNYLGTAVAISGDTAIVGSHFYFSGGGSVYVFERNANGMNSCGQTQ